MHKLYPVGIWETSILLLKNSVLEKDGKSPIRPSWITKLCVLLWDQALHSAFSDNQINHLLIPEPPEGTAVSSVLLMAHSQHRGGGGVLFLSDVSNVSAAYLVSIFVRHVCMFTLTVLIKGNQEENFLWPGAILSKEFIFYSNVGAARLQMWADFTVVCLEVSENQQTHFPENLSMKCSMRVKHNLVMYNL